MTKEKQQQEQLCQVSWPNDTGTRTFRCTLDFRHSGTRHEAWGPHSEAPLSVYEEETRDA